MKGMVDLGDGFAAAVGDPDLLDEAVIEPYLKELRGPLGFRRHVERFVVNAAPATRGPRHHA